MDMEKSRHICGANDGQPTVKLTLFTNIKPQILFKHSLWLDISKNDPVTCYVIWKSRSLQYPNQ